MEKILIDFLLNRFMEYQSDNKHMQQVAAIKDLIFIILG